MSVLQPAVADALVRGLDDDPAAILGPHPDGAGGLRIVTFQPGAVAVTVWPLHGAATARPMDLDHPDGLFLADYPEQAGVFPYRLEVADEAGGSRLIDDPYAVPPLLGELDLHLIAEGTAPRAYDHLGAHPREVQGVSGVHFAVWAPHARWVGVVGDFNDWDGRRHPMRRRGPGGIWELFIPGLGAGAHYKYHIRSQFDEYVVDKADPYAFTAELRPGTASIVASLDGYSWGDGDWMARRGAINWLERPISVYELHAGSWRRAPDGGFLNYRALAHQLVPYVKGLGYTHIELMPLTEHPFDISWGYLTAGYFAATSRFGTPQDLMYLVDYCHRHDLGVYLDWVPSHFAKEEHGLGFFDGAHLYEHADPRQGEHLQWGSFVFNYGRGEVLTFLLSNAHFWYETYHIDGMRVDAVASMLYLDHLRDPGMWVPNRFGGREHLEAVAFLQRFNDLVRDRFPGAVTIAEESTTWQGVTRPTYLGGLGFTMKWNMGWMHDTLEYFKADPSIRRYIHNSITFSIMYTYTEHFVLPFSHDEVVHAKSPLVYKAPGDEWQKFASLRLMLGYMWAHPGKKLLFMGGEFGQPTEWNYDAELPWRLLEHRSHLGVQRWVRELNSLYTTHPELYALDYDPAGFQWLDCNDVDNSVLIVLRRGAANPALLPPGVPSEAASTASGADVGIAARAGADPAHAAERARVRAVSATALAARQRALDATRPFLIIACNFTPAVHHGYRIGVPAPGTYRELLNSDSRQYGGSGVINEGDFRTQQIGQHGYPDSLLLTLPPLGVMVLRLSIPPARV